MDTELLKSCARELDRLLCKYADFDSDAAKLQYALNSLIQASLLGQIQKPIPMAQIPGDRLFEETNLQKFTDLGTAYARFKIQLSGGTSPGIASLLAKLKATGSTI